MDWTPLGGTSAMARASASPPARGGESKRFARGTDHRTDVELPLQPPPSQGTRAATLDGIRHGMGATEHANH